MTEEIARQETNYDEDTIAAIKEAASKGFYTVLPADNQLQLDIDSEADFARFQKLQNTVSTYWNIEKTSVTPSKEIGHQHVTLTLKGNVSPVERVALQAILGSDPLRELLSLIGLLKENRAFSTLFFEKA